MIEEKNYILVQRNFRFFQRITSLSLSASLMCWAMKRTPRNACNTSGVNLRGKIFSDSVSAVQVEKSRPTRNAFVSISVNRLSVLCLIFIQQALRKHPKIICAQYERDTFGLISNVNFMGRTGFDLQEWSLQAKIRSV